tara:strand:- start:612 stop:887 length:276 start_codon:yes stop_codon:yes gene_type:complete
MSKERVEVKIVKPVALESNIEKLAKGKLYFHSERMIGDYKYWVLENKDGIKFKIKAMVCEKVKKKKVVHPDDQAIKDVDKAIKKSINKKSK